MYSVGAQLRTRRRSKKERKKYWTRRVLTIKRSEKGRRVRTKQILIRNILCVEVRELLKVGAFRTLNCCRSHTQRQLKCREA